MTPAKWEIWLVDMPFDEGISSKIHPALVIDAQHLYILVGKMTSHAPRRNYPYEYALVDWQGTGLHYTTTLRLSKRLKLDTSKFHKRIGTLQPVDQVKVRQMLQQIVQGLPE